MRYCITITFKDWNTRPIVAWCKTFRELKEWVAMIDETVEHAYYDDHASSQQTWIVKGGYPQINKATSLIQASLDPEIGDRMRKSFNKIIR